MTERRAAPVLAVAVAAATTLAACGEGSARPAARLHEPGPALSDSAFAALVEGLSEPGGFFDTDNLISNETSYLHVLGALEERGVRGGAYLGVGPDQNFSYLVAVRPRIAFIVDIRRDNVLQHLLFKALFELADTRAEYLSLLLGVAPPDDPSAWTARPIGDLVDWLDAAARRTTLPERDRVRARVDSAVAALGVPLDRADRATVRRFHDEFVQRGLSLRFSSYGRAPRPYYPTLRELVLATDLEGRPASYLADEEAWRFVDGLQERNLVVPVVGDLAGPRALRAIGDELRRRGEAVTAFYVSNVEFYLFREGSFDAFAANVAALPVAEGGLLIRSYFPNFRGRHPHNVPGHYSTQSLQTLASLAGGRYRSYWQLVTRDAIDPRPAG